GHTRLDSSGLKVERLHQSSYGGAEALHLHQGKRKKRRETREKYPVEEASVGVRRESSTVHFSIKLRVNLELFCNCLRAEARAGSSEFRCASRREERVEELKREMGQFQGTRQIHTGGFISKPKPRESSSEADTALCRAAPRLPESEAGRSSTQFSHHRSVQFRKGEGEGAGAEKETEYTDRLTRILWVSELGSIGSFCGLGQDFKQAYCFTLYCHDPR
ncbi:hypothetical protein CRG98_030480, partial [Punica granatum]